MLTTKDYELLQFIAAHPGVTETEIVDALSGDIAGIYHRLTVLSVPQAPQPGQPFFDDVLENGNYLTVCNGKYHLTSLAYTDLQDWEVLQKEQERALKEERLGKFLPIVVSIVSLLVSIYAIYRQP